MSEFWREYDRRMQIGCIGCGVIIFCGMVAAFVLFVVLMALIGPVQ